MKGENYGIENKNIPGYLKICFKHKYYVMKKCFKMGLYWRGLVHDLSINAKLLSGTKLLSGEKSEYALLHHQNHNKHHWQYWILVQGCGNKALKIPTKYLKGMVCDWVGAHLAIFGKIYIKKTYNENKNYLVLHPESRKELEELLNEYE